MRLILSALPLRLYPLAKPGFSGGSEQYVRDLARGLASKGHEIHVVAPDLDRDERRGPNEWWWPGDVHPRTADAVVAFHSLDGLDYDTDRLIWAPNGVGADLAGLADQVDAVAVFTECHADLLVQTTPIPREKMVVTGLGVDLAPYPLEDQSVPGRMFVGNDPARGLWHVLDIFDLVRKEYPEATLHVGYDFDRQFEMHRWQQNAMAEMFWECRERIDRGEGITNSGALSRPGVILEEIECQVHCWPSDPPNQGSQTDGITQRECAAAGCALVLSDVESFPELFGSASTILPVVGKYFPGEGRRVDAQDYAEVVLRLMKDPAHYAKARRKAQAFAKKNTISHWLGRWERMLTGLSAQVAPGLPQTDAADGGDGDIEPAG